MRADVVDGATLATFGKAEGANALREDACANRKRAARREKEGMVEALWNRMGGMKAN